MNALFCNMKICFNKFHIFHIIFKNKFLLSISLNFIIIGTYSSKQLNFKLLLKLYSSLHLQSNENSLPSIWKCISPCKKEECLHFKWFQVNTENHPLQKVRLQLFTFVFYEFYSVSICKVFETTIALIFHFQNIHSRLSISQLYH